MRLANARVSAAAFALAILLGSLWWGAHRTMLLLHDDAAFVKSLTATLDKPAVRAGLSAWLTRAIQQTAGGGDVSANPAMKQLQRMVTGQDTIAPMAHAMADVALAARNDTVAQLDERLDPKHDVRLQLAPLFTAANVKVDKRLAKELNLSLDKKALTSRLLTGSQVDRLQLRYDITRFLDRWAGWIALALLAMAVLTSAKPLRALAVVSGIAALLGVVVPLLLSSFATWLSGSGVGSLVHPFVVALAAYIGPYTWPVILGGIAGVVVFGSAHLLLGRPRR